MAKKKVTYKWDEFLKRLKDSIFRPKRQTKDIVFRLVFGNDRQALLQLYNSAWDYVYRSAGVADCDTGQCNLYFKEK